MIYCCPAIVPVIHSLTDYGYKVSTFFWFCKHLQHFFWKFFLKRFIQEPTFPRLPDIGSKFIPIQASSIPNCTKVRKKLNKKSFLKLIVWYGLCLYWNGFRGKFKTYRKILLIWWKICTEYRYIIIDKQFNDCLKKIKKFIAY